MVTANQKSIIVTYRKTNSNNTKTSNHKRTEQKRKGKRGKKIYKNKSNII